MQSRFCATLTSLFTATLLISGSAFAQSSALDASGYSFAPTALDYVSIAATGTPVDYGSGGSNADYGEGPVTLPWAFPFYGNSYSSASVGVDGALSFDSTANISGYNYTMPSGSGSPNDISVFAEDMRTGPSTSIAYEHDATNDRFIISWEAICRYYSNCEGSFQVHLYPDGRIQMHWLDTEFGSASYDYGQGATAGIQDRIGGTQSAGNAVLVSYNEPNLVSGYAVEFTICGDADSDGSFDPACGGDDCDETNPTIGGGFAEICADGIDQDCSGYDLLTDLDQDGDLSPLCGGNDCDDLDAATSSILDADSDGFVGCDECDDGNAATYPGADELCDGEDNNCDGTGDDIDDVDGDGDTACNGDCDDNNADVETLDADADGVTTCDLDCDDTNAAAYPGATEICDGVADEDCDGTADDVDDLDADGVTVCAGDCNDNDDTVSTAGTEVCGDGLDNDCDGSADNIDADLDGHVTSDCGGDDCDDTDATVNPSATETCDGADVDSDCDGLADNLDLSIGSTSPGAIIDVDVTINIDHTYDSDLDIFLTSPGGISVELTTDNGSYGNNFTDTVFDDEATNTITGISGSGAPHTGSYQPEGSLADLDGTDSGGSWTLEVSDDAGGDSGTVNYWILSIETASGVLTFTSSPGAYVDNFTPVSDSQFVGTVDDADGDGYVDSCGDCDSSDATINPAGTEVCGDTIDQNCDGSDLAVDADGDGENSVLCGGSDCDDADATAFAANTEVCDGANVDNDCDGIDDAAEIELGVDVDLDGAVDTCGDCDDNNANISPFATEICGDGVDDDCDGSDLVTDTDGDGEDCLLDCDDDDAAVNTSATEVCGDSIDNDCDGSADNIDADADGFSECDDDCDDTDAAINPDAVEVCDGADVDGDCDGLADSADLDIGAVAPTTGVTSVSDTPALDLTGAGGDATMTVSGAIGPIVDVNVTIDITHPWDSDISIYLISPAATGSIEVALSTANGGSGDDYTATVFDDDAATSISSESAPFTGTFQPEGSLADFNSLAADGDWTLHIVDSYTFGDHGTLNSWSLDIETLTGGGPDDADSDGYVDSCGDCDNADAAINPGAVDICDDAIDQDCDGSDLVVDADGDGVSDTSCGGNDCDDTDATVSPATAEVCDGADNNCDGLGIDGSSLADGALTTTFTSNNGSNGNVFDLDAVNTVTVTEFAWNLNTTGSATVDIYYRLGSGLAVHSDPAEWTLLDQLSVTGAGSGNPTALPLTTPLTLAGGQTYSFTFHSSSAIRYTNGGTTGDVFSQNDDLIFYEGYGKSSLFGSSAFSPRVWNGTIVYGSSSSEVDVDGDGYVGCTGWTGTDPAILGGDDCSPADANISAASAEVCDGLDNDCNGSADFDTAGEVDVDLDGYISCDDCDDANIAINPGAEEICDDANDDNCDGVVDLIDGDGDGFTNILCSSTTTGSSDPDPDLDLSGAGGSDTITISGLTNPIADVNVTINITHPWDGDAEISLISAAGTTIELSIGNGGSGADYTGTTFDDDATTAITAGSAPFTGSFQPEQPLSGLNGEDANGTWTLSVYDNYASGDHGTLNSWSLDIVTGGDDCDDDPATGATVNSGTAEVCGDTIDNDCDASTDDIVDGDADGFDCTTDCDDNNAWAFPGFFEWCNDGVDNDCDATTVDTGDQDGDGVDCLTDCDDSNLGIFPGATELLCTGLDEDCDTTGAPDIDDGDGDSFNCDVECDDTDPAVNPGALEIPCDGIDNDCDVSTEGDTDDDGDGSLCNVDCDDADATRSPDFDEECDDGIDNDCDPATSDIHDFDGDGSLCTNDCDDDDALSYPGAPEVCADGLDQDCDGTVDESANGVYALDDDDSLLIGLCSFAFPFCGTDWSSVYVQDNGRLTFASDDHTSTESVASLIAEAPQIAALWTDLNPSQNGTVEVIETESDSIAVSFTAIPEFGVPGTANTFTVTLFADGTAAIDYGSLSVSDGLVGFACGDTAVTDVDLSDYEVIAGATAIGKGTESALYEQFSNLGSPNDLDGTSLDLCLTAGDDADGDGWTDTCGDCDDAEASTYPGAEEACDSIDNDCDGTADNVDLDDDGFIDLACGGDDCNDSNAEINTAASEICNGVDDDCDGTVEDNGTDADSDGFLLCDNDCDDDDDTVHPDAEEVCDSIDNNCDSEIDEGFTVDLDEDTFRNEACGGDDCDDTRASTYPGADEICDLVDNDCDDTIDEVDVDEDTFVDANCGGDDCDDSDAAVNPEADEVPYDGIDNDCAEGDLQDVDGDQFLDANLDGGSDCNDNDANVFPGAAEICDDDIDNDCDELLDKDDEECAGCSCEASIVPSSSGQGQGLLICLLVGMMASLRRRRD